MKKLSRYTSIDELKVSKSLSRPQQTDSERESELKEFIAIVRYSSSQVTKSGKSSNRSDSGK